MMRRGLSKAASSKRVRKSVAVIAFVLVLVSAIVYFILRPRCMVLDHVNWPATPVDGQSTALTLSTDVILGIYAFPDARHASAELFYGLQRFAATLRSTGSRAVVVIFMPEVPPSLRPALEPYHIVLITYSPGPMTAVGLYSFSSLRFTLYREFLEKFGFLYQRVMTSDISDVIFQLDPFAAADPAGRSGHGALPTPLRDPFIAAALEETRIDADGINGYWVRKCFGAHTLQAMLGLTISCSGTTVGDVHSMVAYVEEMDRNMRRNVFCAAQGIDQGVHNVILRRNAFFTGRTTFHENALGPFLTMDKLRGLHFNATNGQVLTPPSPANKGAAEAGGHQRGRPEPYAVVHQINRCKAFVQRFEEWDEAGARWTSPSRFGCNRVLHPMSLPT